jgi:hypothetical protein
MSFTMDAYQQDVIERALVAMAEFRQTFGKPLSIDLIAELYVCSRLGLKLSEAINQAGYDALSPEGVRYQVKHRSATTQNIDINSFDFDYLVLVNLDESYRLVGMWRITADQAQSHAVYRPKFRKYQISQRIVKSIAEHLG